MVMFIITPPVNQEITKKTPACAPQAWLVRVSRLHNNGPFILCVSEFVDHWCYVPPMAGLGFLRCTEESLAAAQD